MIVAIHQPQYLPWLPYCAKAAACDVFVYLDNVQFQKNGVQNRNQIKTAQGAQWLTVPVHASLDANLNKTPLADDRWSAKHLRTLQQSYARAPHVEMLDELGALILRSWASIADLNIAVTDWMFGRLGVGARCVRASTLGVAGHKSELVLAICQALGCDTYLSGSGAKAYQSAESFAAAGVGLRYHRYRHPEYSQCYPKLGFLPELSALDLLLNEGSAAPEFLSSGQLADEVAA